MLATPARRLAATRAVREQLWRRCECWVHLSTTSIVRVRVGEMHSANVEQLSATAMLVGTATAASPPTMASARTVTPVRLSRQLLDALLTVAGHEGGRGRGGRGGRGPRAPRDDRHSKSGIA